MHWRSLTQRGIKSAALEDAAPDCKAPVIWADVNSVGLDARSFRVWTVEDNRALLRQSVDQEIKSHLPQGALELLARYPEQASCNMP